MMVVWDQHTGLSPLFVKVPSDSTLDLDCRQVLCSHWPRPRLLDDALKIKVKTENTYPLAKLMFFLVVWDDSNFIPLVNPWSSSNYRTHSA